MRRRTLSSTPFILAVFVFSACFPGNADAQSDSNKPRNPFDFEPRTTNGSANHPRNAGATNSPLLRISYADYPDNIGNQVRVGANPRIVSNIVADQAGASILNKADLTDATWAWGQFIDHDLGLSDSHPSNGALDIPVLETEDILFPTIFFNRANHTMDNGVREQINEVTSFLDGSQVYGSDRRRAKELRLFKLGRMKTSKGNLLPFNVNGLPNLGEGSDLFLGGDIRVNENVVLTSMHTLFVREHNRIARRIVHFYPEASDEQVFQLARRLVTAEIQMVTYEEFLPALLGPQAPSPLSGSYDPRINPTLANEFSGALFRIGHTLLSSKLVLGDTGKSILLRDAFTNTEFIVRNPNNIDQLLLGLSRQRCQEIDSMIIDDVRNFLFLPPPFSVGLDLAALNIQRGREHGLPPYNEIRIAYGLAPVDTFDEITSDVETALLLKEAYGDVELIDPWLGGISEDHFGGANVGELMVAAIRDQFIRSRDGDRFFYTRDPIIRLPMVYEILGMRRITLGRVIRRNTTVRAPIDMFFVGSKR